MSDLPDVSLLKSQINDDMTLQSCRELASKNRNGYCWDTDLLFHSIIAVAETPLQKWGGGAENNWGIIKKLLRKSKLRFEDAKKL